MVSIALAWNFYSHLAWIFTIESTTIRNPVMIHIPLALMRFVHELLFRQFCPQSEEPSVLSSTTKRYYLNFRIYLLEFGLQ